MRALSRIWVAYLHSNKDGGRFLTGHTLFTCNLEMQWFFSARNRQWKTRCCMKTFPTEPTALEQSKPQRDKTTTDTKQSKTHYPESCGFLAKSVLKGLKKCMSDPEIQQIISDGINFKRTTVWYRSVKAWKVCEVNQSRLHSICCIFSDLLQLKSSSFIYSDILMFSVSLISVSPLSCQTRMVSALLTLSFQACDSQLVQSKTISDFIQPAEFLFPPPQKLR